MGKRVARTRAGATWTEARYFGFIRNALRSAFQKYPVKYAAKRRDSVVTESGTRYRCASCDALFKGTEVQVDHITPCGSLKTYSDLPGFVERLYCEVDGFQTLCKPCHQVKTNREREERKRDKAKG